MTSPSIIALLAILGMTASAQSGNSKGPSGASCLELDRAALGHASSGRLVEAEAAISGEASGACAGLVLHNVARAIFALGRLPDAERLAEQSVRVLEKVYPPDNWVLLRPLQLLADVQLETGKTARARGTIARMQTIRIQSAEDSAVVHVTAGALRQFEGRRLEAETEYQAGFAALQDAGRGDSSDAASILDCLASLYLKSQRLDDARRTLERSFAIYDKANDARPIDYIKFLGLRGVLHARLREWKQAEQDLRDALAIADQQPSVEPVILRLLLSSYSYVLRRTHHRREARSIETRVTALPADRPAAHVVDFAELLAESARQ